MGKINAWRVFVSGVLFAVVGQIAHTIGAMAGMKYYLMEAYFPVWSKIMMPSAGPPPSSFMAYSLGFGLIAGILTALCYGVIKNGVPGETTLKKGLIYGFLVFLVGGIPGYLSLYLLINLPAMLIFFWSVESLIINLLGGMIIAKMLK